MNSSGCRGGQFGDDFSQALRSQGYSKPSWCTDGKEKAASQSTGRLGTGRGRLLIPGKIRATEQRGEAQRAVCFSSCLICAF